MNGVTRQEIQKLICGNAKFFTLTMSMLKDRIGSPTEIRILRNWCQDSGRDVVRMIYPTDVGFIDVFCPIEIVNHEETVIDGWVGAETSVSDLDSDPPECKNQIHGIEHLRGLFDKAPDTASATPIMEENQSQEWKIARQTSFGDLDEADDAPKPPKS